MSTQGRAGRWARTGRIGAAALTLAAVASGVAQARPAGSPDGGHSRVLDADVRAVRAAGGAVEVLAETRTEKGTARSRTGAGVPWDAQFRTASTSKTFVAVVVLQLAAEGRLSLDDTVERWLPGLVRGHGNDGSRITVRDLLQHTSGLFDYVRDPEVTKAKTGDFEKIRNDATPAGQWVALALRHPPLFVPDHRHPRWAYSNTNYLLAGMIAEKAGGLGWREQVEHRIIAPLGLRHTFVPGTNPFLPGPHAAVTVNTPAGTVDFTEHSVQHTADSGVVSTTGDLNTFFRALLTGRLLPKAQLAEMQRTVVRTDDPEDLAEWPSGGYGLGLRWTPLSCGGGYWHHEGDGLGSYTRTGVTADGRRTVAVSITSAGSMPDLVKLNGAARQLADDALCGRD
ncbi:serine hydrolase domain-containing protein [Streptomyces orinoci]|uniref:Serine hydrolase domain-containing protein n=1 Tax=Streptomyces orinoci TaxID=67339 RepID=A0ABV3JYI5_STRON|nr:serine hydrolase domain-containing protein [Streptomyces orinoci]